MLAHTVGCILSFAICHRAEDAEKSFRRIQTDIFQSARAGVKVYISAREAYCQDDTEMALEKPRKSLGVTH